MSLIGGTRLGPFEVVSPLGAGGMGEVYRARDTRLSREVAVKVLPAELSSDAARLKRFEKEALSASSLNHPNIVTIYEVGREGAIEYIAMELVEGKTLRALIGTEPLPVKKLLSIAAQIADGLAKAHDSGIIHRDLKPENVMVTSDGLVKILDFGLAKLTRPEPGSDAGLTQTPTISADTSEGVVVGTVGYMSPEQACGRLIDFRSDQFSFGAILYEMATGRRAFQRETTPETLAAVIREEPEPIAVLNAKAPVPLRWITERCLAKDPRERYAATEDLARDLAAMRDHLSDAVSAPVTMAVPPARKRVFRLGAAAAVAAAVVGAFLVGRSGRVGGASPTLHQLTFRRGGVGNARFAADGRTVVYDAQWEGTDPDDPAPSPREVFSTRKESPESRSLGLKDTWLCSVSPTGELALVRGTHRLGTLVRVPMDGGAPREVLERVYDAAWAPDGGLAVMRMIEGRLRVEFPIGKALYETGAGRGSMRRPTVARGGDVVRFGANRRLMEVDRAGKSRTLAELDAGDFAWAPSGEEVFVATSSGSATEISAMRISGSKRRIGSLPGDWALHDVAHDGSLLMERIVQTFGIVGLAPGEARPRNLEWLDRSVAEDVSADGSTVLFNDRGPGGGAAYLRKMDGSPPVRLGDGDALAFSPDAKWVLTHRAGPPPELVLLPVGPGESRHLPGGDVEPQPGTAASWSRDGKRIVFYGAQKGRSARAFVQDVDGGPPRPVTPEGRLLRGKAVSPDGKWVISEDGNLQPVDGGAPRPIPGLQPGDVPFRFSADGRALVVASEVSRFRKRIFHIDLTTGTRTQILEVAPRQPVGDGSLGDVHLSDDEKTWVYSYMRYYSELYVVEGLK